MCNASLSCQIRFIKTIFSILNFFFLIHGVIAIIISIRLFQLDSIYKEIPNSIDSEVNFVVLGSYALVVGIAVIFMAIFGLIAVCCENTCMLTTYACIIVVTILVDLGRVITFRQDYTDNVNKYEHQFRKKFNQTVLGKVKIDWLNSTQDFLECCGWSGANDFPNRTSLPESCCTSNSKDGCTINSANLVGKNCADTFKDIREHVDVHFSLSIVSLVGELICLILALSGIKKINLGRKSAGPDSSSNSSADIKKPSSSSAPKK